MIILQEQECLQEEHKKIFVEMGVKPLKRGINDKPYLLGITPEWWTSYFIGADWVDEKKGRYVVVKPKKGMENIDYFKMFNCCINQNLSPEYFSNIYGVDLNKKFIPTSELQDEVTPLIIMHYYSLLKRIIHKGLKKDYIEIEQELSGKIKGRVLIPRNINKNILNGRLDRAYCRFQIYTEDIPENRLLKKALVFAYKYLTNIGFQKSFAELSSKLSSALSHFDNVGDDINYTDINLIISNSFFTDYKEAIRIAKLILKRFGFSLERIGLHQDGIPAFWIDMSRLYEVYVYGLLHDAYGSNIKFQVPGSYNCVVDFLKIDESLIIDTKYKPRYADGNNNIIEDIRQLSGYARDKRIRKKLPFITSEAIIPCVIIYPQKMEADDKEIDVFLPSKNILDQCTAISSFEKFYKIGVKMPFKK